MRIDQLFNIIVEYPESEPALIDLKQCLEKINMRTQLVTSLKTALETRLLHPGSNQCDVHVRVIIRTCFDRNEIFDILYFVVLLL